MYGQSLLSSLLGWYPDKLAAQLAACSGQRIPSSGAFHTYFKWPFAFVWHRPHGAACDESPRLMPMPLAPTAPQLLFPYQPSSPRSHAVLAGTCQPPPNLRSSSVRHVRAQMSVEGGLHLLVALSHLSAASPRLPRVVRLLAKTSRVS